MRTLLVLLLAAACGGGGGSGDDDDGDGGGGGGDGGGGNADAPVGPLPEVVATVDGINGVAIAIASDGSPRILFHGGGQPERVYYAEPDGAGWSVEELPVPLYSYPPPYQPELALDSSDAPHVLYSSADDTLTYSRRQGGSWLTVETPGMVPFALARGPGDSIHIAYDAGLGASPVEYATWNGSSFDAETVMTLDVGGLDLAVAGDGTVHLVVTDRLVVGPARHAVGTAGAFTEADIPSSFSPGRNLSIALDADGLPHVAASMNLSGLYWLHLDGGGSWAEVTVDAASPAIGRAIVVIDDSDTAHLAIVGPPFLYFRPDGAGGLEPALTIADNTYDNEGALAVAPDGTAHAVYPTFVSSTETALHYVRP
jgi:hypothetical protein